MAGGGSTRGLDETPTWAVASVCAIIALVSILIEKGLHRIGKWFTEKRKVALYEALEKVKAELMVLGFISLLLTVVQSYIAKICIPERVANTMLPCSIKEAKEEEHDGGSKRRLLWSLAANPSSRRILADDVLITCPHGKVPLVSVNGLHQLHIFIFFLAVSHLVYSALTMALGRAKIRRWKEWELATLSPDYEFSNDPSRFRFVHETSFVKPHMNFWNRVPILLYVVSFFRQFFRSVRRTDYLAMRHGFIIVHLAPGSKFNFQKYIMRSLEDDFKKVVEISPILWVSAVLFLLMNVRGWDVLFWVSLLPPLIILAVGTKLRAIISQMAVEIQERQTVVQGIPLVQLGNSHFWFGRPRLVLSLIHFALFQNAFQITYFFWIWYDFGLRSCFHENFHLIIIRVCIGAAAQVLCSYVTLPLYALVSQMGSHMRRSIFDEHTSRALKKWHQAARKGLKKGSAHSPSISPSTSTMTSPSASPLRRPYGSKTFSHLGRPQANSMVSYHSDHEISDQESCNASPSSSTALIPIFMHRSADVELTEHHVTIEQHDEDDHDDRDFSFARASPEIGKNR